MTSSTAVTKPAPPAQTYGPDPDVDPVSSRAAEAGVPDADGLAHMYLLGAAPCRTGEQHPLASAT